MLSAVMTLRVFAFIGSSKPKLNELCRFGDGDLILAKSLPNVLLPVDFMRNAPLRAQPLAEVPANQGLAVHNAGIAKCCLISGYGSCKPTQRHPRAEPHAWTGGKLVDEHPQAINRDRHDL